ncbi:MAG TPA: polysaccharide biosynthesis tyrosine autokinase [Candidatus Aquicultor sp.]|jgi:receptor protein-tyrosine kinase
MEEQIDFLSLAKIVFKHKVAVTISMILCVLAAVAVNTYTAPRYKASSQILLSQGRVAGGNQQVDESYQAMLLSQQLAKTFTQIALSRSVAQRVIDDQQLKTPPEELKSRVEAVLVKDTQLIQITVTDTDSVRAALLANTYAKILINVVKQSVAASSFISMAVVDQATAPLKPVSPRPVFNLVLGIIFGILVGISSTLVLEQLDTTVKDPEQLEELIKIAALGRIPVTKKPLLLVGDDFDSSEFYRSLRTNLQYLNFDRSIRTIVITSANMGEGKTTVSVNLATVFAKADNKVLLIDCDMRRPMAGKVLNRNGVGLSGVLAGKDEIASVVKATDVEGLWIITSGAMPPNPADLLDSERMASILGELKEAFDIIIMDCPPILGIADTVILASKADAVLLVAYASKTKKHDIVLARDSLDKVGARILGFVTNGVHFNKKHGYYNYKPNAKHRVISNGVQ